jgi:hypothetical protein
MRLKSKNPLGSFKRFRPQSFPESGGNKMTFSELNDKIGSALLSRNAGGIFVALYYDRQKEEAFVYYSDETIGLEFEINPPKFLALDCYIHPIIYFEAEMRGISNPKRLVPAAVLEGDFVA